MALDPLVFVEKHGVVLASGKGPVPNLAQAIAGEPIRGSWWAHERGKEIFRALGVAKDIRAPATLVRVGAAGEAVHA